jgi:hypothetical protein
LVSAAEATQQRRLLNALSVRAQGDLTRFASAIPFTDPLDVVTGRFIDVATGLYSGYGEVASSLAANFYDTARAADPKTARYGRYFAPMVDLPARVDIGAAVRNALTFFTAQDDPAMALRNLAGWLDQNVKNAHRATIREAAEQDPAPSSSAIRTAAHNVCDFCARLEASGVWWTRGREEAPAIFHPHCNCVVVPVFGGPRWHP